jgi:uncharacterized membrane protein YczE
VSERWFGRRVLGRLPGLLAGFVAMAVGTAAMANAGLGLGPWQVFHQGISVHTGLALGTVQILVGIPILALWWPLGERPGIGTILNVALVGVLINVAMPALPSPGPDAPVAQVLLMAAGVLLVGVGSGLYLAADLGAGPRDGIMVGIHHRVGWSIRRTRTGIELAVLLAGFLLGGTVGLGTVVFALGIGPAVQVCLGALDQDGRVVRRRGPELREELEVPAAIGEQAGRTSPRPPGARAQVG